MGEAAREDPEGDQPQQRRPRVVAGDHERQVAPAAAQQPAADAGASSATASRLKKPATSNAPTRRCPRPGTAAGRPGRRRRRSARGTRATATLPATASAAAATLRTRPSEESSLNPHGIGWRHRRPRAQRRSRRPERRAAWRSRAAHRHPKGEKPPDGDRNRPHRRLPPDVTEHLTTEDRSGLLRAMLMMRGIEERAMTLYRQGKVPGSFYDGFGQEAVSAGRPGPCRPRTASASCTATSPPTSSAASSRGGSSPSTWAARTASPRPRRQRALRRPHQGLRRHGLDAPRHDADRDRHGDGVQAARRSSAARSPGSATARPPAATSTRR